jgi:signal transduction histidine kinase/ActR/RegA family two-component response regulator
MRIFKPVYTPVQVSELSGINFIFVLKSINMKRVRFEYKFTLIYLSMGFLWIFFSDRLVESLFNDTHYITQFQTYKGMFYVASTAILFFYYLKLHITHLRKAKLKAEESDKLKSAFLQNISHEIRTPMNGIIGFSGLLKDNNLTKDQKNDYLKIIIQSSERLLELVNQMLDISLIETGNIQLHHQEANLGNILQDVYELWHPRVKNGINFSFTNDLNDDENIIITDEYKLKQVLNNLIGNAVKFTEKGHIHFGCHLNGNEIEFIVEDTGIGIAKEHQHEIFKRFRKAENGSSHFYNGAGIGLAICKGNLELLKGNILVESNSGVGSVFRFTIPYHPAISSEIKPIEKLPDLKSMNGLVVLVAEDEILNFRYIEELLADTGVILLHAANGLEAVDICRKRKDINLVLMDIKMPVMNGFEATRLIKEIRPELPVIAQTAYIAGEEKHRSQSIGFSDFLSKPFLKEDLLHSIELQVSKMKNKGRSH